MDYKIIDIKSTHYDDPKAGGLSFFEAERDVPFPIRRMYWIYDAEKGTHRGFHAHTLNWQLLFCPHGSIDLILDDGKSRETVTLDDPAKGLVLTPGLWREMIWNETGSILCVAASEYYDPEEYIRDYDEFIAYRKKKDSMENEKK
ncbi:MAG: FdtA/QdtA family cupin domain-containing protein [Ruminococcus sp.]|nr:FdtA/QdtA family cupin domain-containing protein [Ruminococcus sp.]